MIENPVITVHYALTYREYVAAHKLGVRQSIPALIFHIVARYCALIVVFIMLLMSLVNILGGHGNAVLATMPFICLIFLMPCSIWVSWWYGFKRLQRFPPAAPKMTFQANAISYRRSIQEMGDLTWLWSATHGISVNKKVVLISMRRGCFIIIPRHAIPDDQINRLKEFLRKNKADA